MADSAESGFSEMDFVAIDFETASGNPNSACQLGLVEVRHGEIVREECWLIRPPRLYFSPRNIAVHGIRPKQVAHSPAMADIWSLLSCILDGKVIMAHNARFDINVLVCSLAAHDIACPQLEFTCTRALSRCAWPGRSRYGLAPLGQWLGIQFEHHDALEDARCCASIALAVAKHCDCDDLSELENKLRIRRGRYHHGVISSPATLGRRPAARSRLPSDREPSGGGLQATDKWGFPASRSQRLGHVDASAIVNAADGNAPLLGKNIVMLGPLRGLSVADTAKLITDLGGNCQSRIDAETHYVVACGTTLSAASHLVTGVLADSDRPKSSDPATGPTQPSSPSGGSPSRPAPSQGMGIRLLSERQFRALLPGGKCPIW